MDRKEKDSFIWSETKEPHALRRREILKAHPDVKKLYGHCTRAKYWICLSVFIQFLLAYLLKDQSWPIILVMAYTVGGVINHSLLLGMHELSHNLVFKKSTTNIWFSFFANLPTGIPSAATFRKYHLEHHKYQGHEDIDSDIPSQWEVVVFKGRLMKMVWLFFQPLFYAIRPLFLRPKPPGKYEVINFAIQIIFNVFVYFYFGPKALCYFLFATFLSTGLHPMTGHFISEHYVFKGEQETYSYYGPLNYLTYNVGYHNEHHDFPNIAGANLPRLKALAPEYYDNLHSYSSWTKVIWDYIMRKDLGPYARVKRKSLSKHVERGDLIEAESIL